MASPCAAAIGSAGTPDGCRHHYHPGVSDQPPAAAARIPDQLRAAVAEKLALAEADGVARRLRSGDATLWGPAGTPEIANRLGWLTIAERMLAELDGVESFAEEVRDAGITDVVLLGMGGSSLAPEVLRRTFGEQPGHPRLQVLDSTDAARIRAVQDAVDPHNTLFIVSSKSGGTIEPLSLFAHFWSLTGSGSNFAAVTDPSSGLAALAEERGFRRTFFGDPDIGGRYSALSAFGILPAALIGVDVRALLTGAGSAWETDLADQAGDGQAATAAVWLGAALSALAQSGRDKLTFLISESLPGLGLWLEQLVAESTGKRSTGILPVAEEPLGAPELYGGDRVFAHLPDVNAPDPDMDARARALADAGHPLITIPTRGPGDLGRIFLLTELAVAVAGWGLEINPFDQPNVQQAKDATNSVLAEYESRHELPQVADGDEEAVRSLLLDSRPPEYVAIMAYSEPSAEFDQAAAGTASCDPQRGEGDDDLRLWAALPSLDRAVSQGRPEDRALSAARPRRPAGREHPGRPLHLHHPQERAGDRRPEHAQGAGPARRAGAPDGRGSGSGAARAHGADRR